MSKLTQLPPIACLAFGSVLIAALSVGAARADPPSAQAGAIESRGASALKSDRSSSKDDRSVLPEVTIKAQREALTRRLDGFVRGITSNPRYYDESLPRWRVPVCFAVAGLASKEGSFVLDRLSQITRSVGMRIARGGCQYNFFVVFSENPDDFIKRAFRLHRRVFNQSNGNEPLRRFLNPSKPQAVRVWHNANAVSRNGAPISADGACATVVVGSAQIPVSCQYFTSRIEFYDVFEFSLALVVIDMRFPKEAKLGQVVDYAAMVGLADIDLDKEIADAPTILRLFATSQDPAPSGLTPWDRAFLSALYHTDQGSTIQRSQIVLKMVHDVSPPANATH